MAAALAKGLAQGKGKSLATLRASLRFWVERPDLDPGMELLGAIIGSAAKGPPQAMRDIAKAAGRIRLERLLVLDESEGGRLLACDGDAKLHLPRGSDAAARDLTCADHALAMRGRRGGQPWDRQDARPTHCPGLDALAIAIEELGLHAEPLLRGGPQALLDLVDIQTGYIQRSIPPEGIPAMVEAVALRLASAPGRPGARRLRI